MRNGELLTGTLCKKILGPSPGGLVHLTWMEHGPDATRLLINNMQQVCEGCGRCGWIGHVWGEEVRKLCVCVVQWIMVERR